MPLRGKQITQFRDCLVTDWVGFARKQLRKEWAASAQAHRASLSSLSRRSAAKETSPRPKSCAAAAANTFLLHNLHPEAFSCAMKRFHIRSFKSPYLRMQVSKALIYCMLFAIWPFSPLRASIFVLPVWSSAICSLMSSCETPLTTFYLWPATSS